MTTTATAKVTALLLCFLATSMLLAAVHVANATGGLALDGKVLGNTVAPSQSVTLSTANSPDVIYLAVAIQATGATISSVSDRTGLTWKTRASEPSGDVPTYTWYAIAGSPLSSDSITVTISGTYYFTVIAFGISGADTSSPFDPNSFVPASTTGTGVPPEPSVTISTTGTNDMIIGVAVAFNTPTLTPGSSFTSIEATSGQAPSALAEDEVVSSPQSSLSVGANDGGVNTPWTMIADAVVAPGAIPDLPSGFVFLAVPVLFIYYWVSRRGRTLGGGESRRVDYDGA